MIASIRLENFQNHKDTTIDFEDGLNAIVGPSDNGKSAINKAVDWVINGEPTGDEFVMDGTNFSRVTIIKCDGDQMWTVAKVRDKKKTYYTLKYEGVDDPEGYEYQLDAAGRSVPKEVTDAFNFNSSSIQTQFEPFFLLTQKPSAVARDLQELAGITEIGSYNKVINSKSRAISSDISTQEDIIESTEKKLECDCFTAKQLSELEDINNSIISGIKRIQSTSSDVNTIESLLEAYTAARSDFERAKDGVVTLKKLYKSLERFNTANEKALEVAKFVDMYKNLSSTVTVHPPKGVIVDMHKEAKKLEETQKRITTLQTLIASFRTAQKVVKKSSSRAASLNSKYTKKLKKNKVCPTCGGTV